MEYDNRMSVNIDIDKKTTRPTDIFDKEYFFGSVYTDYDKFYNWENYALELIGRYSFASFLDVGCGCGNLVKEIKLKLDNASSGSHDIQGIDSSQYAVSRANSPFIKLADCRALPFADCRFEMVYVLTTFSYLPSLDGIKQAISEAYRVSSHLIVFDDVYSVPDKDSIEYDPYRQIVYFQEQWLSYWQEVLGERDRAEINDYEIVVRKDVA